MTRIFSFGINCFGHSRWYCCTGVSYARKLLLAGDNVGNMTMMEKEGGKVCIQRIIFSLAAIGSMQYHPIILRACLSLVIISAKNLKRHVSFLKVLYAETCAYKDICIHLFCHPTLTAKFFYNFPHRTFQPVRSFNGQCNGSGTQPISLIFEYFQITLPGECILETK